MKNFLVAVFVLGSTFLNLNEVDAQVSLEYQVPSESILKLADFERAPSISMDTEKHMMLLMYRNTYKTLAELNQEELKLAGLRVNPITNISSTISYINNLKIRRVMDVKSEPMQVKGLPSEPQIAYVSWSPDDSKIAFTNTTEQGVQLWVINVATGVAQKVSERFLNANTGRPFSWLKDSNTLLVKMIPQNRKELINFDKSIPKGPTIQVAEGVESQNRTYQDLLKNPTDEENFETLVSSEMVLIDVDGVEASFLSTDLYVGADVSPDGNYVLITTLQKPFSYIVPMSRFPMTQVVYDLKGNAVKTVNEIELAEVMPKGFMATRMGKRSMSWRNDLPASLYFVQALDEGNPAKEVAHRDELFVWNAPFNEEPASIFKTQQRFAGVIWGDEQIALVYDNWYDTRNLKTYLINPSNPTESKKINDRNYQDVYSDPGDFQVVENQYKESVLKINKGKLYLIGSGYTPKGQFPFVDEYDINTGETTRLYTSDIPNKKESIISIEDYDKGIVLVNIQSQNEYPNYYFRNLKKKKNNLTQLTHFKNPFESIMGVEKRVVTYEREDGVMLSGTLYLPAGYDKKKKEKLPLLIWAYPKEYKDKNSAGQNTQNENEFTYPYYGSFIYWVTKGYAVLDDAAFPIIGEGAEEPNDSFIKQLVANGRAAIDYLDNLGYIDRNRVAVGGHSYGAFMTANLLTHSDDYACGIARSGAYNRTLTPFGFQSEQRNYWDVPEVYNTMSPFMNAHKMKKPILLIHGEADNNPGTFTLQTERYFQAIKGLGGDARMVLLPKESHSYVAKENILHLLWEQEQFLDKHLKK